MTRTEEILTRLAAGEQPQSIADSLGVSLRRIYQVRGEKPREKIGAVKSTEIRAAISRGRSQREVAAEFGCSRKTVAALCTDMPVDRPSPAGRIPAETIAHILARSKAGHGAGTIARECEMSDDAVRAVLRRHPANRLRSGDAIMSAIVAEMESRGLTAHGLAQIITAPPTRETLYEYMRGDSTPTTPVASRLLESLGLEIRKK